MPHPFRPALAAVSVAVIAFALAACAQPSRPEHEHGAPPAGAMAAPGGGMRAMHAEGMGGMQGTAVASLTPTQGQTAAGLVMFRAMAGGQVMVHAHVTGLKPNGEHGFHVHENGNCASPDGSSAGGHFNPTGAPHGTQAGPHHAGDMPSLKANAQGVADAKFTLQGVGIGPGGAPDLSGRSVVVHANPDDYATQPTGNSGGRIACGVIARHP
jgi:Cu-Zn family superoxide dismutase